MAAPLIIAAVALVALAGFLAWLIYRRAEAKARREFKMKKIREARDYDEVMAWVEKDDEEIDEWRR